MTGRQRRAVVVGALNLMGKELIEELNASAAAAWRVHYLHEGDEEQTEVVTAGDEPAVVQPLTRDALEDVDLVFFAGEGETAREHWRAAVQGGAAIVDLTGALEGEAGFLVRSPWIQGGTKPDLMTVGVVAAHPAAVMLALAAERLARRLPLARLAATVLEPASQAGKAGLDELHQQTVGLLSFQNVPKELFDTQIAFNLQTTLGEEARVDLHAAGNTIRRHLHALLGEAAASRVHFQLVQAPVFHGYTVSAFAELTAGATDESVRSALHGGVVVAEEAVPSNLAAAESGDLLVDVREDGGHSSDSSNSSVGEQTAFWLWMASDNLRFAARNAVAAAMELVALRPAIGLQ